MKKFFLIAALVLAVVSSLVAGTLAAYSQTLDLNAGNVTTKEFEITADTDKSFSEAVKLAPGDNTGYKVKINNKGEVKATVRVSSELLAVNDEPNTQLELTSTCGAPGYTVEDGVYVFVLDPNDSVECTFTVTWPYDGDDAADTAMMENDAASQLKVSIKSTSINVGN